MGEYKYKAFYVGYHLSERELNEFSEKGWKLVGFTSERIDRAPDNYRYIFIQEARR